jgi:dihydrofolate reductase
MRKVISSTFITLDGLMVGPNKEMDWVLDNFDAERGKDIGNQLSKTGAILLRGVTYEIMANYWPTATMEDPIITDKMNNLPKIIFSRTLEKVVDWKNSMLVKENIAGEISQLKQQPGKDMVILGSAKVNGRDSEKNWLDLGVDYASSLPKKRQRKGR